MGFLKDFLNDNNNRSQYSGEMPNYLKKRFKSNDVAVPYRRDEDDDIPTWICPRCRTTNLQQNLIIMNKPLAM